MTEFNVRARNDNSDRNWANGGRKEKKKYQIKSVQISMFSMSIKTVM